VAYQPHPRVADTAQRLTGAVIGAVVDHDHLEVAHVCRRAVISGRSSSSRRLRVGMMTLTVSRRAAGVIGGFRW
jgi:hypothetical protein